MKTYRVGICRVTEKQWILLQYDICTQRGLWEDENRKRYLLTREETEERLRPLTGLEVWNMEHANLNL